MNCLKIHQNGVGGTGWARGTEGGGGGGGGLLGQTIMKDKPKKVQLLVFLSKIETYPTLLLGTRQ